MSAVFVQELSRLTTILTEQGALSRYAVDGKVPQAVALPATEQEVAAVLQAAAVHDAAVAPRGGGSKGDLGNTPTTVDLVLSLERLNQVIEYVPEDMTITVQAGMRFADLQALVHANGQTVPIDPPRSAGATIGGVIVANSMGPQRLAYGSIRDHVLGSRLALVDGRAVKTGGRVVKNVAGYDMNKLIVGSLGTLAVMTEVSLKLRPLAPVSETLLVGFTDLDAAQAAAEAILQSELLPVALTLLSAGAAKRLGAPGPVALAVQLAETQTNVAYQAAQVRKLTGAGLPVTLEGAEETVFWEQVRNYGDQTGAAVTAKVNTVIAESGNLLAWAGQQADGIAHVGTGTVYLYGYGDDAFGWQRFIRALYSRANEVRSTVVIEAATAAVKQGLDVWGLPRPEQPILQQIKQSFDPRRTLNPGRYVGGI